MRSRLRRELSRTVAQSQVQAPELVGDFGHPALRQRQELLHVGRIGGVELLRLRRGRGAHLRLRQRTELPGPNPADQRRAGEGYRPGQAAAVPEGGPRVPGWPRGPAVHTGQPRSQVVQIAVKPVGAQHPARIELLDREHPP